MRGGWITLAVMLILILLFGSIGPASARSQNSSQSPQPLFSDDFSGKEPKPEWSPTSGNWYILQFNEGPYKGERFYALADQRIGLGTLRGGAFTYVRGSSTQWKDYAVEVDIFGAAQDDGHAPQYASVVIRAADDLNKIMFVNHGTQGVALLVMRNGQYQWPPTNYSNGPIPQRAHVRVEALGNTIKAYVNGVQRAEVQLTQVDDILLQGWPGLSVWYNLGVAFDNFKVESLGPGNIGTTNTNQSATGSTETTPSSDGLKGRLDALEPKVNDLQTQLGNISSSLTNLNNQLSGLDQDVVALKSKMDKMPAPQGVDELKGQVSSLTTQIADLNQSINSFKTTVSDLSAAQLNLKQEVDRIKNPPKQPPSTTSSTTLESIQKSANEAKSSAQLGLIVGAIGVVAAIAALLIAVRAFR